MTPELQYLISVYDSAKLKDATPIPKGRVNAVTPKPKAEPKAAGQTKPKVTPNPCKLPSFSYVTVVPRPAGTVLKESR